MIMPKYFIAFLGAGKGSWGHIARIMSEQEFEKILLISNDWGKEHFTPKKEAEWILVDNRLGFETLKDMIKEKLPDGEYAVSLASGTGKDHTALLAALKEKKIKFELVILTSNGTKFY